MFTESCEEVKNRLISMCEQVEQKMAARADEVFVSMQRDYTEVISGTALPQGQKVMPKWERKMRAEMLKVLEDRESSRVVQEAAASLEPKAAPEADRKPEAEGEDREGVEGSALAAESESPFGTPGSLTSGEDMVTT